MRTYYFSGLILAAITAVGVSASAATAPKKPAVQAARKAAARLMAAKPTASSKVLAVSISNTPNATAKPAKAAGGAQRKSGATTVAQSSKRSQQKLASKETGARPAGVKETSNKAGDSGANSTQSVATEVADGTKVGVASPSAPAAGVVACSTSSPVTLSSMQPLNPVVNTAPINSSEPQAAGGSIPITTITTAPSHPMMLTPAPAYEVAPAAPANQSGKMAKIGGWFNQRVLRRGPAQQMQQMPMSMPSQTNSGQANAGCATNAVYAAKPAASSYLIASPGSSNWPPAATNVAARTYGGASDSSMQPNVAPGSIPSELKPAILIVKLSPGVYPAAIGSIIDKIHGMVLGSHGPEYMRTLRIAVNRNDVQQAMRLLSTNRAVQYVVPEELLGVAGHQR